MRARVVLASLFAGASGLAGAVAATSVAPPAGDFPRAADPDLELRLYAEAPLVVTPVGLAVDRRGRPFVVESHTHTPPPGYAGPPNDRIKVLVDRDGDGRADEARLFADPPIDDMMNVAFAPDGGLYVVHRTGVTALYDRDGDDRADEVRPILRTETPTAYDHSGLLGLAFGDDGWLYLSRGNVGGSPYTYVGTGGARLFTYGDGGHVVRVRPDGSAIERVAAGFWNPFDLKFDHAGRLLATDNDPDSRGPNRLLQIVPGADYGYRARYGSSGLHPHSGWSGELPGTLPYIGGVGESPGGLLDVAATALPAGLRGGVLVAIWAENTIELHRPRRGGPAVSGPRPGEPAPWLSSERATLVKGGLDFRPVALAAAPDGTVFVTDWVKKEYPNHGHGRVWTLRARPGAPALVPRAGPVRDERRDPVVARIDALGRTPARAFPEVRAALCDPDPFVRAAASARAARADLRPRVVAALRDRQACVRLGAMAALRWAGGPAYPLPPAPPGALARLLADPDHDVRFMALLWTAETVPALRPAELARALTAGPISEPLVRAYLATQALLTPAERAHLAARKPRATVGDAIDPGVARSLLRRRGLPAGVAALALPYLGAPRDEEDLALVLGYLRAGRARGDTPEGERLAVEALRSLGGSAAGAAWGALVEVARDPGVPVALRREALAACAAGGACLAARATELAALADAAAADPALAGSLARALRLVGQEDVAAAALARLAAPPELPADVREAIAFSRDPGVALEDPARPATRAAWLARVGRGGDPAAGRELFFGALAGCSRCHRVDGRGGVVGPDLSNIGRSVTREQLLDAILDPSAQVSPEFQAFVVEVRGGEVYTGLQFHLRGEHASLRVQDGEGSREKYFKLADIDWGFSETSLMPAGLEQTMAVSELRDLLAYLESRGQPPPGPDARARAQAARAASRAAP